MTRGPGKTGMDRPVSRLQSPAPDHAPEDVSTISADEWMLVRLREQLYGGNWEEMLLDLESRLRGEPYIFKLASRIQDDLNRIHRLRDIETRHGCDLKAFLPPV